MELTIKQTLQQGIAAHKKGKLQDAERLYRAILQSQPLHPDANHNLGVLAVSVNKVYAALPLFKIALEANPKIEQFWLSYIDALIKEQQFEVANQVLEQAEKRGFDGEKLNSLKVQIVPIPHTENAGSASPSQAQLDTLLELYQNGRVSDSEDLAMSFIYEFPKHQFAWKVLGAVLGKTARKDEALTANQKAVQLMPQDAEAHYNLGNTLLEFGRLGEAEAGYKQAIALKPDYAEAHNNLGNTLKMLEKLEEAELSYKQTIALKPDYAEAHNNLGTMLKQLGRIEEAEVSFTQAIVLKPDYVEACFNLGVTLQELGRLEEAEVGYKQAIALKPNYAEAYNNLGNTLKGLDRLEEAELSYKQAIALKSDFAEANNNLGILLYATGDKKSALSSIKRANAIDPKSQLFSLLLSVMQERMARENTKPSVGNITNSVFNGSLPSKILILKRLVEKELITYLYKIKLVDLDKENDPSFGNTKGSRYNLFQDDHFTIKKLEEDLKSILMKVFSSNIFLYDSFLSIFGSGGGTNRHNHVNEIDKDSTFSLAKQKYSLVYYLSVGDQDCSEPGVLQFYEPSEDILPRKGFITIFPADRYHSSVYGGNKDRVIIGVNFYTL